MPRAHRLNDRNLPCLPYLAYLCEILLQMLINNADQMMIATISDNAVAAVWNVNSDYEHDYHCIWRYQHCRQQF